MNCHPLQGDPNFDVVFVFNLATEFCKNKKNDLVNEYKHIHGDDQAHLN